MLKVGKCIFSLNHWYQKIFLILFIKYSRAIDTTNVPETHVKSVVDLTEENIDYYKNNSTVLFVVFGAEWCHYSKKLKPIFQDAAKLWIAENPSSGVVWANVDSVQQTNLANIYGVEKYPTLKVFLHGVLMPYEFRSSRTITELHNFVRDQLKTNIKEFSNDGDLEKDLVKTKKNIIAYISCKECIEYKNFQKIAAYLRKDCDFWAATNEALQNKANNTLVFIDSIPNNKLEFSGNYQNYDELKSWVTNNCVSLVREVTFDNVEELTEQNIPFLIFFRDPADKQSEKMFVDTVKREISDLRQTINPLLADGHKFAHPLKHLGKDTKDLPVLAIDSFQHMFLFENMNDLHKPGKLREFVQDLHSGELHKNFHKNLEDRIMQLKKRALEEMGIQEITIEQSKIPELIIQQILKKDDVVTNPPKSVFKELKPSDKRYTLIKQEL